MNSINAIDVKFDNKNGWHYRNYVGIFNDALTKNTGWIKQSAAGKDKTFTDIPLEKNDTLILEGNEYDCSYLCYYIKWVNTEPRDLTVVLDYDADYQCQMYIKEFPGIPCLIGYVNPFHWDQ